MFLKWECHFIHKSDIDLVDSRMYKTFLLGVIVFDATLKSMHDKVGSLSFAVICFEILLCELITTFHVYLTEKWPIDLCLMIW